jgi:hypothetical protein
LLVAGNTEIPSSFFRQKANLNLLLASEKKLNFLLAYSQVGCEMVILK